MDAKKAVGIDKVTKEEYEKNLDENLKSLVAKMKSGAYKPHPSRRVYAEIIHMKQHVADNPKDKYANRGLRTVEKKRADLLRYLKEKQPHRFREYMERIED